MNKKIIRHLLKYIKRLEKRNAKLKNKLNAVLASSSELIRSHVRHEAEITLLKERNEILWASNTNSGHLPKQPCNRNKCRGFMVDNRKDAGECTCPILSPCEYCKDLITVCDMCGFEFKSNYREI